MSFPYTMSPTILKFPKKKKKQKRLVCVQEMIGDIRLMTKIIENPGEDILEAMKAIALGINWDKYKEDE